MRALGLRASHTLQYHFNDFNLFIEFILFYFILFLQWTWTKRIHRSQNIFNSQRYKLNIFCSHTLTSSSSSSSFYLHRSLQVNDIWSTISQFACSALNLFIDILWNLFHLEWNQIDFKSDQSWWPSRQITL